MGRPGSALDNAVIESWHSTVEFELRRVEHFATRAAARARVAAWIEDYNHQPPALGLRHDVTRRLGAGPRRRAGGRVSAAGRCAAQDKKAASPLTYEWLPRSRPGDAPREGTGPPLRPQGCCAPPAGGGPCGAGLDPGDHCGPSGRKHGQALACPARGAARPVPPVPGAQADARNQR